MPCDLHNPKIMNRLFMEMLRAEHEARVAHRDYCAITWRGNGTYVQWKAVRYAFA